MHFGSQRVDVICKLLIRAGAIHAATRGCEGADLERAGFARVAFALGSPIQAVQAMSPNREQVAQQLGLADHPAAAVLPPSELEHTAVRTWHDIVTRQAWDDTFRVAQLEGFVANMNRTRALAAYAQAAADEEDRAALEMREDGM